MITDCWTRPGVERRRIMAYAESFRRSAGGAFGAIRGGNARGQQAWVAVCFCRPDENKHMTGPGEA